ncbi:MAG: LamG domain-containing protein [candidate division Zixibacteria bacterium]|nr:LamG domain-containing protein [Gammaproteobacteria bacterium]NIR25690.1 LamG domain-containing protein [Gammaproteobacteria bacterium]NIR65283.1 LamG domain-containing protein [candidate division Zixibacteria bacterium]NIS52327.1 LamG domain-containing protein [Phycisphaerae bacterium]NIX02126.1 hypothetical protein [Phycisphaerae bacterium]
MARSFNGSTQYLRNTNAVLSAIPFTMAGWWNYQGGTYGGDECIVGIRDYDIGYESGPKLLISIRDPVTQGDVKIQYAGVTYASIINTAINSGWNHAAAVSSSSTSHYVYMNGTASTEGTNSASFGTVDTTVIGASAEGSSNLSDYFNGYLGEIGIWDAALTSAEINALAAGVSPLLVRTGSLVSYWPLIRDEDQDRVGGYDMTAYNTPTVVAHPPVIYPAQVYQSFAAAAAPPAGISIPVVMHHRRQLGMS